MCKYIFLILINILWANIIKRKLNKNFIKPIIEYINKNKSKIIKILESYKSDDNLDTNLNFVYNKDYINTEFYDDNQINNIMKAIENIKEKNFENSIIISAEKNCENNNYKEWAVNQKNLLESEIYNHRIQNQKWSFYYRYL